MRRTAPARIVFAMISLAALGGAGCQVVPDSSDPGSAQATVAEPQAQAEPKPVLTQDAPPAPIVAPEAVRLDFEISGELTQGGFVRGKAPSDTRSLSLGGKDVALAADGTFFAAFDRDAGRDTQLVATTAGGQQVVRDLRVSPRAWNIEHVNLTRSNRRNPEAYWKKREPEYNAIVAARAKVTDAQGWRQDFIWPVKGRISGRFGSQRIYRGEPGSYHSGIDIAPGHGTPFVAPADGVVVLATARPFSLEGYLLIIDHGNGLNSAFLHNSKIAVREGETVKQGQYIGNVGSSGSATGPHLHWGLKWNDARLDPLLFAGPM